MKTTVDLVGPSDLTLFWFNAFCKDMKLSDLTAQAARDKTEIPRVRQNYPWRRL